MFDHLAEPTKTFELVVCVRNSQGEPTGKRQSFASDSAYKISSFWHKYVHNTPRPKSNKLPNAQQAEKLLKEIYKDKN